MAAPRAPGRADGRDVRPRLAGGASSRTGEFVSRTVRCNVRIEAFLIHIARSFIRVETLDTSGRQPPRPRVASRFLESDDTYTRADAADFDARRWRLRLVRSPGEPPRPRARFSTPRSAFSAEQVAQTDVPTLVMWGEEDKLIPYEAAGWYMDHLPDATLAARPPTARTRVHRSPPKGAREGSRWRLDGPSRRHGGTFRSAGVI